MSQKMGTFDVELRKKEVVNQKDEDKLEKELRWNQI